MTIGDWVLVVYEGEKYLGKVLSKRKDEVQVHCLEKLWGIQELQQFERIDNAIFYKEVYASVLPQNGLRREENGFGLTSILYLSDLFQINLHIKIWTFLLP